jgi:outer membrane protein insertion porin family
VRVLTLVSVLVLLAALAAAQGSGPIVEDVKIVGGTTINADTVEYYLGIAKGDPYDADAVVHNFHRFWDSGLVEELKVEAEDIAPGKVRLIITVRERPKVSEFAFSGNGKVSTSTIKEKLDTANVSLKRNVPLRTSEIQRLRQAILDVYAKEGYAAATVDPVVSESGPNQRKVTFRIDEGTKIRIGSIKFVGNQVFSARRLRGALKKIKEKSLFHPFGSKLIWSQESWGEDSENLKKFYMNHGYKDIMVGEPRVNLIARNPAGKTQKDKKFRMEIVIPVQEGKSFKIGSLSLKGNTVFPDAPLRKLYYVKLGKTYNYSAVDNGNEAVKNLYHGRGYIYAYTNPTLVENKEKPGVVDVVISIFEGDRFRLGRLEFSGNTKTQDKVLRREFRLAEGDWMDMPLFKRSVFKVNQLGYYKLKDDPIQEFKPDDEKKVVNVILRGDEVGRTDIQFGAGYSEIDHLFLQFNFNTRNFLGRGETLGLSLVKGSIANSYSLSFSEPYFLDKRMLIGGSIYKTDQNYTTAITTQPFSQNRRGFSAVWGVGVGYFGNFALAYGREDVHYEAATVRTFFPGVDAIGDHQRPLPTPYKGILDEPQYYYTYTGLTSALTPSYVYDSRDDPFDPSNGLTYFARLKFAGGPLGGDFHYRRPEVGISGYKPWGRRVILAANLELGMIRPIGSSQIAIYDRYRLGGEKSLRAFEYYSVLPRQKDGTYFYDTNGIALGGDRYFQLNLEYQIKVVGPLKFILFADAGNTWFETQGWDFGLMRYSYGGELRIFLPVFQAPLRFIYGINPKPFSDEKKSLFTFSIGTTF